MLSHFRFPPMQQRNSVDIFLNAAAAPTAYEVPAAQSNANFLSFFRLSVAIFRFFGGFRLYIIDQPKRGGEVRVHVTLFTIAHGGFFLVPLL